MLDFLFGNQLSRIGDRLEAIEKDQRKILNKIEKSEENLMATLEQHTAALSRIDAATSKAATAATAIAARITALEEAIKSGGLTPEQETALLAQTEGLAGSAEALAAALEPMGKKAEEPVPVPAPPPVEPVGAVGRRSR